MDKVRYRHEIKYMVNEIEYNIIRERLKHGIKQDENIKEDSQGYHIRSLYFDDIYRRSYYDKLNGILNRIKFRVRIYNLSGEKIRFEAKIKKGDLIRKEQIDIERSDYEKIIKGAVGSLYKENLPEKIKYFSTSIDRLYKPLIVIDYIREAYVYDYGNVRITFDKELKFGLNSTDVFDENIVLKEYFDEPVMIMEIKFDDFLPDFIRNLIQIDKYERTAFSKYANCVTAFKMYKSI